MYEFKFERPATVRRAANLLGETQEAQIIAGGHTLVPVLKQRLAQPSMLIDISCIEGLNSIEMRGRSLVIGATACHSNVANSPIVGKAIPALAHLAGLIGDPAVRHRGTIGGSLANNDPTADYPAACLALDATIVTNKRRIKSDEFFQGLFTTALEADEIITRVTFPLPKKAAYQKFRNQASRYALAGVFVACRPAEVRVAVTGAGANGVFRVTTFEAALKKGFVAKSLDGVTVSAEGLNSDIHGSADYRAHLISVLARRAVEAANA
jgi:aerobic carbon-monoxide dehydrogenase medium subunit